MGRFADETIGTLPSKVAFEVSAAGKFSYALSILKKAIGGRDDGGREALRDGMLGELVTPGRAEELVAAVLRSVAKDKKVPEGLAYFSFENFEARCHAFLSKMCGAAGGR